MRADRVKQILDTYNVVWTTPSKNSGESMPCGGGDIGLNVWVEDGDILIYLAKSGTFDELNRMPKLGRIRVTLDPNPFLDGESFRQELKLYDGHVEIVGRKDGLEAKIDVWVDLFSSVVHFDVGTNRRVAMVVAYENWRLKDREFLKSELHSARSWAGAPESGAVRADVVKPGSDTVSFVHRNVGRAAFDLCVEQQGLPADALVNPLKDLNFGGLLFGTLFEADGVIDDVYASTLYRAWRLKSVRRLEKHRIGVLLHSAVLDQDESLDDIIDTVSRFPDHSTARKRTANWWHNFWTRSHLFIDVDAPDPTSPRWQVARNYHLFRYQLACNAFGEWPTKFNGGLFTFDPEFVDEKKTLDPDFRQWGGGTFTAQNQRLVYWPMLKSGDVDMMRPAFDFYLRNLKNAEARAKHYWGIDGACFVEQIESFGLPVAYEYGWKRPPDFEPGIEHNAWVSYQWDTVFEFCLMMLEAHAFSVPSPPYSGERVRVRGSGLASAESHSNSSSDDTHAQELPVDSSSLPPHPALSRSGFAYRIPEYEGEGSYARSTSAFDIRPYLPLIESCLRFYDAFYRGRCKRLTGSELDDNGKLAIYPGTACETYKDARNPSSTIAALQTVLTHLCELPDDLLAPSRREHWRAMLGTIPAIAFREMNGHTTISPAWSWSHKQNCELPQLYPVYPFGLFGVGRPNLDIAINTWKHGIDAPDQKQIQSWHQDAIFCARLGLTEEAAALTIEKLKDAPRHFPTFWGPGHDWVPDHNWGGSGMIGLQEMLLQCVDEKLYLFPAWPRDWDVEFKLHARGKTTVECVFKGGKIESLIVTPREREKDVVLPDWLR